jgi:hypothetical protein
MHRIPQYKVGKFPEKCGSTRSGLALVLFQAECEAAEIHGLGLHGILTSTLLRQVTVVLRLGQAYSGVLGELT